MALITGYVSSKEVYERVMARTGQQYELNIDDSRLAIADLMDMMNLPQTYIQKVIGSKQDPIYKFTNYTVPLPCDFYRLLPAGIAVDGNPVRWRTNSFHYLKGGECCDLDTLNNNTDIFKDNFGNEFSPQVGATNTLSALYQDVTFDISDGTITFNVKEGDVCLAYYAYPLDNDGFVMIPDNAKYKRAVANYLIWQNDYILWRQNAISDKVYQESKNESSYAIAAASSAIKMPSEYEMSSIKATLIRLLPKINHENHFYGSMGIPESRPMR